MSGGVKARGPRRYGESGIYSIIHRDSGRMYIGSAGGIQGRWWNHQKMLRAGTHHCVRLQRAFNKYGEDAFDWQIVEACAPANLLVREQFYLDNPPAPLFNSSPTASSPRGTKHRPEVVEAMRLRVLESYNDPVFRDRHAEGQRRRFARPEEREAHRARRRVFRYVVTSPNGAEYLLEELNSFASAHGFSQATLSRMAVSGRVPWRGALKGWMVVRYQDDVRVTPQEVARAG